ncbi:uncharacterized protein LOC110435676 [Sorghum bicolor]|uniref:uncharacterized protein LOC110435676 n=1 Tax=Sorghum bicolor TaxID=4558 RepID=UPI000B425FE9|nr:uncharacterized protein LOC110435676 [Sorghum bicolor]XP_021317214.1 uncharacterized protein LOC110435676 [Sorghum bicolor]XP_021317215.1 uncharacterized protein LOC110435676 [Sorghum bicolor]XP_021317216.1 uncharacterized protein LOC110435676 [Sorghum bicolor]|eukprot:XP_021317213.1 uncharacterized protein LOC110435676 [Sorghum bicolor]
MVLGNRGEALVEEVFQTVVVRLDDEAPPPEVRPPVPHGLDEADELALVGGQRAVTGCHWSAEERDWVALLSQDRPKPDGRRVTFDGEQLGEVRHGEDGGGRDGGFEGRERRRGCVVPGEALLLEERRQRRGKSPVAVDELAVVSRQAEKPADCPHRAGRRPVVDRLHLGWVHGHARRRYDMAEVGDRGRAKRTFGALDEELVVLQFVEDGPKVAEVVSPCPAVNENIIKKYQDEAAEERPEHVIHQGLERRRGVAQPERHHQELVEAVVGAERRLVHILRPHPHLVVPGPKVELGEELGAVELVEELVNHRDRKSVLDGERIERPVVDAETPRPVRLLDEENRR